MGNLERITSFDKIKIPEEFYSWVSDAVLFRHKDKNEILLLLEDSTVEKKFKKVLRAIYVVFILLFSLKEISKFEETLMDFPSAFFDNNILSVFYYDLIELLFANRESQFIAILQISVSDDEFEYRKQIFLNCLLNIQRAKCL